LEIPDKSLSDKCGVECKHGQSKLADVKRVGGKPTKDVWPDSTTIEMKFACAMNILPGFFDQ
jgi:hypothetical protein